MKQNLLIIEKNEGILFLLNTVLQKSFRIHKYGNCLSGIDAVKSHNISSIVISADSEDELNYDFIVHLKTSYLYSSIPVFVITNNDSSSFSDQLKSIGVTDIIQKPFDPLSLLKKIEVSVSEQDYVYESPSYIFNITNTRKLKVGFLN